MENYTATSTDSNDFVKEHVQETAQWVTIGLFTTVAIIHAAFKTWNYCRKHHNSSFNARTVLWFIIYCIETIGNYLLLLSSIICIYIFVVYKGQTVKYVSLPNERMETVIKITIIVAFGGKIMEMISLMRHHRSVNIFFIDWEQPRKILDPDVIYESPHTSLKKLYMQKYNPRGYSKSSRRASTSERIQDRKNNRTPSKSSRDNTPNRRSIDGDSKCHPSASELFSTNLDMNIFGREYKVDSNWSVSTWRTCFVANQWLGIKTKRKTSVTFQMTATLFILEVIGVKFWSLAIPKWSLAHQPNSRINENIIFTSAIAIGTFMFIYSLQWFTCTLYEIYIKNCLQEFVDLCSVANISTFILSHDYLGYYIHGRSVHGFADKDLASLINDLESEENNECAHRGLVPGTREQTFVVTISKSFRSCYNDILINDNNMKASKFSQRYLSDKRCWNERWRTRSKLHEFFCSHLDHCLKNVDYTVQERCFVEKLCDIEITNNPEKSIFYIDRNHTFDQTIFHGNEWIFATFELVTFLVVLILGGNWITGAVATIFISKLIACIAQMDQKKQLAANTLIDKRFLI